ncbi:MAG: glycoside hydrolase family 99-like domain-containing protein [Polyangiales bacterium]
MSAKIIAQYFPQLHPILENDQWWGKGFTDWVNVKRGTPAFPGHQQPRVPLHGDHYDQSRVEVVRAQVELAKAYGVYGFSHYHYWFDGKQLLETPTNLFMAAKDLDFHFCLAWANETWSKRWDGLDHHILQLQTHPPDKARWALHFDYLIKAWTDDRSIRIDGKPLFLIYRPHRIEQLGNMLDYWRTRAQEYGLPGLYFAAMTQHLIPEVELRKHFDAVMLFQPFVGYFNGPRPPPPLHMRALDGVRSALPKRARGRLQSFMDKVTRPTIVDYDMVWKAIVEAPRNPDVTLLQGAFVDWDNTARYRNRATIFAGSTPYRFEYWMKRLLERVRESREQEQLVFINAWNEWAEGAYLEPDEHNGFGYLEALKRAVDSQP